MRLPWRGKWKRPFLIVSGGYLLLILCIMIGGCADRLILYPTTGSIEVRSATPRAIPFEGGSLEIWAARSPAASNGHAPEAYVLAFIGNADRAEYRVADALDWGDKPIEIWAVNPPGFGGSTGPASLRRLPAAALAAYDTLARQADGRPIFISGVSLGTTLALHVAANRRTSGLLLRTPPPMRALILGEHGWWNLWMLAGPIAASLPPELDSIENGRKAAAPAIFLLADRDEVVPHRYQQMVVDAYAGPKQVVCMSGASHNTPLHNASRRELGEKLDWMWQAARDRKDSR